MTTKWLDLAVAAAKLKLPYNRAYNLMLRGVLEGKRVEGRWQVAEQDVERLLAAKAESSQT